METGERVRALLVDLAEHHAMRLAADGERDLA